MVLDLPLEEQLGQVLGFLRGSGCVGQLGVVEVVGIGELGPLVLEGLVQGVRTCGVLRLVGCLGRGEELGGGPGRVGRGGQAEGGVAGVLGRRG